MRVSGTSLSIEDYSMKFGLRAAPVWVQFFCVAAGVSLVDAVAGRLLHAHPDPSGVILGSGAFLVARRLLAVRRPDVGAVWGVVFAATYLACFSGAAAMLVGWNQSLPWVLTSHVQQVAVLAGVLGGVAGAGPTVGATPPNGESTALAS
jgi:hypothetical protein